MFIAHLPAGYLLANRMAKSHRHRKPLIAVGLFAAILPDLDLIWFYLVDDQQTNHHAYFFHWPLFWLGLALCAWLLAGAMQFNKAKPFIQIATASLLLHMALDSIAAEIGWLRPFFSAELHLVHIPSSYDWWVWNFIWHWTFALELIITLAAAFVFWRRSRPNTPR
ncbi:MAG: metal-dependent hydrolase [Rhodobacteraceae bacterium]|nr:metal-dependent hydrolase [Paracoccaceae bacterium]